KIHAGSPMTVDEYKRLVRAQPAKIDLTLSAKNISASLSISPRHGIHRESILEEVLQRGRAALGDLLPIEHHVGLRIVRRPLDVHIQELGAHDKNLWNRHPMLFELNRLLFRNPFVLVFY